MKKLQHNDFIIFFFSFDTNGTLCSIANKYYSNTKYSSNFLGWNNTIGIIFINEFLQQEHKNSMRIGIVMGTATKFNVEIYLHSNLHEVQLFWVQKVIVWIRLYVVIYFWYNTAYRDDLQLALNYNKSPRLNLIPVFPVLLLTSQKNKRSGHDSMFNLSPLRV